MAWNELHIMDDYVLYTTLPETISSFTPEIWCLEDDPASFWGMAIFICELFVSGKVVPRT